MNSLNLYEKHHILSRLVEQPNQILCFSLLTHLDTVTTTLTIIPVLKCLIERVKILHVVPLSHTV